MVIFALIAGLVGLARAELEAADPMAEAIGAAVIAHVASTAHVDAQDVELRWLGLGAPIQCGLGSTILVDSRPGEDFRGRTELRVSISEGGEQCARMRLPARIAIWQTTQLAAADAAPGTVVSMVAGRAPRHSLRGDAVDPSQGPWIAVHMLRAGATVTDRDVISVPSARAGDPVQLQAIVGALRVETEAHLLNDARIGEQVRVANTATGTVVRGVLVDARTVRVGGVR